MSLSSALYAAGYLTGLTAFILMARRRRLLTDGVLILLAVGLLGGLASGALGQWLFARSPGKSVLAALAGGYLAVVLAKRALGIRRPLGDLFAVALSAGEAVGRWGCFYAGCCYGKACAVPWGVHQHDAFRHPTQLYLSLASFAILVVLLALERIRPPENCLFYVQGLLYCCARFAIEFAREVPHDYAGLSAAQWGCLVGLLFFAVQLMRLKQRAWSTGTVTVEATGTA